MDGRNGKISGNRQPNGSRRAEPYDTAREYLREPVAKYTLTTISLILTNQPIPNAELILAIPQQANLLAHRFTGCRERTSGVPHVRKDVFGVAKAVHARRNRDRINQYSSEFQLNPNDQMQNR